MRRIWIAIAIVALGAMFARVAMPAAASPAADVMATVHQFVNSVNHGDTKTAAAACADETTIIDEFPPHSWHGAGACLQWMRDFDADSRKNGVTDGKVTLGPARHVDITGDLAYVVVPANYDYKQKGKPVREVGSLFTLVLQKGASGWRIIAWSWAKH